MTTTIRIELKDVSKRAFDVMAMVGAKDTEVILTDGGVPIARLVRVPPPEPAPPRIAGLHPGAMVPLEGFDDPIEGFDDPIF
jgi:antitoxin (DNA-binding transcriptional repressor) of toxin-antitoxin stability system